MVKGYTAVSMRMAVVALLCAFSASLQAAHHGTTPKKHRMTCSQKVMALLCLSTGNVVAAMQCVKVGGEVEKIPFTIREPLCNQEGMSSDKLRGAFSVALQRDVANIHITTFSTTPCTEEEVIRSNGMMGKTTTCLPLHHVAAAHFDGHFAHLSQVPQIVAP